MSQRNIIRDMKPAQLFLDTEARTYVANAVWNKSVYCYLAHVGFSCLFVLNHILTYSLVSFTFNRTLWNCIVRTSWTDVCLPLSSF